MFLNSKLFRVISIFTLILSLSAFVFADTITLKDGSIIKGKIISFDSGQFIIVIGDGARQRQMKFFADEIQSIKFDSKSMSSNTSNTNSSPIRKEPSYTNTKTVDGETIITVGSAPRTTQPPANNPTNTDVVTPPANNNANTSTDTIKNAKPIRVKVKVLADNTANGWTNAGWVVRKGQKIRIIGSGRISLGNGRYSAPSGISTLPDSQKLIKDKPTGGLIAVIGDDNNDFVYVGSSNEFIAKRDGALFLGVNEGLLDDNSGSYEVTIEIDLNITK